MKTKLSLNGSVYGSFVSSQNGSRDGSGHRTVESPMNNYLKHKLKSPALNTFSPGLDSSGQKSTPTANNQLKFRQFGKKGMMNDMRKSMTQAELEKLELHG